MGNVNHQRYKRRTVSPWRVLKDNQRQLPCHKSVKVRIKVVEPGIQSRWCDRCETWVYFVLEPMTDPRFKDVLKLRWLTPVEAAEHEASIDNEELELIMENWK